MKTNGKHFLAASLLVLSIAARVSLAQSQPGTLLWRYDLGETIGTCPVVTVDGTVYVVSTSGLRAITNNGVSAGTKWTLTEAGGSTPSIGVDGTIYIMGYTNLSAVDPAGFVKWTSPVRVNHPSQSGYGAYGGGVAIGWDNMIYCEGDGHLYAIRPSGSVNWSVEFPEQGTYTSPALASDGTIYAGAYEAQQLYAFASDGTQKWVVDASSGIGDSPAIADDGTIYVNNGILYVFTPQGANLWNTSGLVTLANASPVIAKDGSIFIQDAPELTLYRITSDGAISRTAAEVYLWHQGTPVMPAVDAGGTIWHWASNMVFALSSDGQVLPSSHSIDDGYLSPQLSPTIGADGTFYGVRGSRLYAITTGTTAPSRSHWPMYRANARHTGKIERPSLEQPKKRADANFEFQLYAQIDQTQTVQTSTDLVSWSPLTNIAVTNVPMDVVDLCASNFPTRFYRTLSQ